MGLIQSFVMILLLGLSCGVMGTPKVQDYGNLPDISMLALSPDGNTLAMRKSKDDQDIIAIYSLAEKKYIKQIDISAINPHGIYFISNTELVFGISDRTRIRGFIGEHTISAAYSLSIKNGSLQQLLRPGDNIYPGQTNVGVIVGLSPDRTKAYMPAFINTKSKLLGPTSLALMEVKLNAPKRPKVFFTGHLDTVDYFLNAQGEVFIEERYNQQKNLHTVEVKTTKGWQTVYSKQTDIRLMSVVGLTPDYRHLVVMGYTNNSDRKQYLLMSLDDGSLLDAGINREDADVEDVISDINRVVHGVRYSGFIPSYKFFDEKINQFAQEVLRIFPENSVQISSWLDGWKKFVVYVEGPMYAGDYFLVEPGKKPGFLVSSRPNIAMEHIHTIARANIKARDGMTIPMLLTIPKSVEASIKNMPTVLLPHGGPQAYDAVGFDWMAQALANEGYLVVQPQFRGSDGFGYKHFQAGLGEWGLKMQDDLTDALKFLTAKGYTDPQKVCIVGASYGGYAALAGGAFTPDLYKCIVSLNGVSSLERFLAQEKRDHGRDHAALSYWNKFMTKDGIDKTVLHKVSPVNFANVFKAPVLLIHGEHDETVDFEQSIVMNKALKKAKKPVEFIILKEESHYLENNATRLKTLQATLDFLSRHLK
jgi:dipeptidyl aminopeptidase/acylaminoacyl peptidase